MTHIKHTVYWSSLLSVSKLSHGYVLVSNIFFKKPAIFLNDTSEQKEVFGGVCGCGLLLV